MQLLTVLGTGKYDTVRYTWQNQELETCYVVEALCHFFKPQQVKVFTTAEAKEKHWKALSQRLKGSFPIADIPIPSGKSELEVWQIFDAVVSAVEPGSKVIFDITHAFRSIPLLILLATAFLQKAKGVEIQGVYYGAFEANREAPPIFDLTPTIKLLDWLTATDKFLSTGSSVELGQLLSTIQQDFYRKGKLKGTEIRPTRLKSISDRIQAISRSIELVRPLDLLGEADQLEKIQLDQIKTEIGIFAKPFELLLEKIQRDYCQFALPNARQADSSEVLQKQFLLLRWYVAKDLGSQAILLAREWLVSAFCTTLNQDYLNRTQRGYVENEIYKVVETAKSNSSDTQSSTGLNVQDPKHLAATWSKLTEYRNDLAHTQMRESSIAASTLQTYVQTCLLTDLTAIFPQFTL